MYFKYSIWNQQLKRKSFTKTDFFVIVLILFLLGSATNGNNSNENSKSKAFFANRSNHTNNWAVLVCSSRYWFNYRHVANVLSLYTSIKRLGIPDSNIIMMLADNIPCNARNPYPPHIYNSANHYSNLYPPNVEVDYRGYETTAENLVRLLTGRLPPYTPRNKRLLSDRESNVLIYLTGHGGDGFLKFQDSEELTNVDLADAITSMEGRYNELLLISDTCQSESMYQKIDSPGVLATSSSLVGEDSLSHHVDRSIGVYIIDRYAYYIHQFLESNVKNINSTVSMDEFFKACDKSKCISTVGVRRDLFKRPTNSVPIIDFFGSNHQKHIEGIDENLININWDKY